MRSSHTVIANVIILFFRQLATWGLSTAIIVLLPRYLGDEGLGQLTFATSFNSLFASLVLLGVPTYLVKEIARDRAKLGSHFFNALAMRVPLSAVAFMIVFVSINLMGYSTQTKSVIYVACLTMAVFCLNNTASSILQGIEKMGWLSFAEVAATLVSTVAGVLVLVGGHGVVTYALVVLLGASVNLSINLAYFIIRFKIKPQIDFGVWRTLVLGGLPFLLTSVLSTVYQSTDATMLRFATSEAIVGWYGAALQLLGSLNFIPMLVATAVLPALSRLHASGPAGMAVAARKSLAMIAAISLPMAVGTVLVSDKIIAFLGFPEPFHNSAPLLAILSTALPLTGMLIIASTVVIAADKQRQWAILTAVGVGLNIVLNLVGIPVAQGLFGNAAIGTAGATVAAETVVLVLALRLLPKGILDESVFRVFAKSSAGSAVMGLIVWWARGLDLVMIVAIGVLVYGIFSIVTRLVEGEDLMILRDVVLRRRLAIAQ
ncbi:MAG: flippase [Chloroflexi bacterium]|nr:flippase [Chloroflexota bacterium]